MAKHQSGPGEDEVSRFRTPTRNEQQIALVLLDKVLVSNAARTQLRHIADGQPVDKDAFRLMDMLAEAYVKERRAQPHRAPNPGAKPAR